MSNTIYDELLIKIDKMTTLTRAGVLQWEKVLHRDCKYQVVGMSPRIAIICIQSECGIEIGERYYRMNCDDLTILRGAVMQQIRQQKDDLFEMVKLLDAVLPSL